MVRTGKPLTMVKATGDLLAMKDSVAAHQAKCSCHVVLFKSFSHIDDMIGCCDRKESGDARDSAGRRWHIDPLCRVRPEAKA